MTDLVYVLILIIDILAIQDVVRKIRGDVAKFLWIVCVISLPFFGAGFWYYVQYHAPREKKRLREERKRKINGGK